MNLFNYFFIFLCDFQRESYAASLAFQENKCYNQFYDEYDNFSESQRDCVALLCITDRRAMQNETDRIISLGTEG